MHAKTRYRNGCQAASQERRRNSPFLYHVGLMGQGRLQVARPAVAHGDGGGRVGNGDENLVCGRASLPPPWVSGGGFGHVRVPLARQACPVGWLMAYGQSGRRLLSGCLASGSIACSAGWRSRHRAGGWEPNKPAGGLTRVVLRSAALRFVGLGLHCEMRCWAG